MNLNNLSFIFKFFIIGIIYIIIFLALFIMYRDIKNGDKKKRPRKSIGLEILEVGKNSNLKRGSIIPIQNEITIGRKNSNTLILQDPFVSGKHVRIFLKNNQYFLEDMGSTNGTLMNNEVVKDKEALTIGDEIKIGSSKFKVIG